MTDVISMNQEPAVSPWRQGAVWSEIHDMWTVRSGVVRSPDVVASARNWSDVPQTLGVWVVPTGPRSRIPGRNDTSISCDLSGTLAVSPHGERVYHSG